MSTNESRPNGYKTLLRFGQVSLVSAALGVGYLALSQDDHRNDAGRSLEIAKIAHHEASNTLANLMKVLPATLTQEQANLIVAAAEREQARLMQRTETMVLPATPMGGYLYPGLSLAIVAALLGMAWLAHRLQREISLTNNRMRGRVEIVEALVAYLRGDEKIDVVDEALNRLEELKGEVSFDPRVRRTYSALRTMKEEIETLATSAATLRENLIAEQAAGVTERERHREEAARLRAILERAQGQAQSAQAAFTEEMLKTLTKADERGAKLLSEASKAGRRITELEARLKCVSARLRKSLDLNKKTVELASEAQTQVAHLAASTTRIGERAGVIRNVVSRTDMLSLNASIEAVKAGPAGKGFTVVAEEVKSVVEQISEQLAYVTQETNDVDGSTDKTAAVIGQVVAMTKDIEALMEEGEEAVQAAEALDATQADSGEISELQAALTTLRKGREDFTGALDALTELSRDLSQLADRKKP